MFEPLLPHHERIPSASQAGLRILIALLALGSVSATLAAEKPNVLTWHNDNARTGQILNEKHLTPNNVNFKTFGKLFTIPVDGRVDAQPLYASQVEIPAHSNKDVLFIATEHDSVYAVDAGTGERFWHVRLLAAGETPADPRGCGQISPEIGITATPVIDRHRGRHGVIYVVAMNKDAQGHYSQKLHALDMTDGSEEPNSPTAIEATFPSAVAGNATGSKTDVLTFDPGQYAERAALLLTNGVVYTAWTSHCDRDPYTGWIIGYSAETLKRVSVLNVTANGQGGAIWQSGAGPAADPQGFIYLITANGSFDTTLEEQGFPSHRNFGNSFLKLSAQAGKLAVADYFTMFDVLRENASDGDLGSGGPMVLPDLKDAIGRIRHLVIGAGKDLNIYLTDRNAMGKFNAHDNHGIYQELPHAFQHSFARPIPAYFDGLVFYGTTGDPLRAFSLRDARLLPNPVSQTALSFGYPGVAPSISADGSRNGIVWLVENQNFYDAKGPHEAILRAYAARDLSRELYNSNQAPSARDNFGPNNKFITPMIAAGRVYVGTPDSVAVFGLLRRGSNGGE